MKTTLDIPDALLRRAKILAAKEGLTLRDLISQALQTELDRREELDGEPTWKRHVGGTRRFGQANVINDAVNQVLGRIDDEIWK